MFEKTFIKLIKAALEDEALYNKLGDLLYNVICAAIADALPKYLEAALTAEINFEDGKSEPGRIVETTKQVNMIAWLSEYIPGIEGALRGMQSDVGRTLNRATQTRDIIATIANKSLSLRGIETGITKVGRIEQPKVID